MFISVQYLSAILTSPVKTYFILLQPCLLSCNSLSVTHLWVSTGGVIVSEKYNNDHLELITATLSSDINQFLHVYILIISTK